MGAWGIGTFENDDAVEWLDELQASADSSVLQTTLEETEDGDEYLEAPEGIHILCAGEIIAALQGQSASDLPDEARDWVQKHKSLDVSSFIPIAIRKIDQVLDGDSELRQLWQENKADYPAWSESVLSLKTRLSLT